MTSMPWDKLLGLPLEDALKLAREAGVEPRVTVTSASRRGREDTPPPQGSARVIRVREGELTVSLFMDGDPRPAE